MSESMKWLFAFEVFATEISELGIKSGCRCFVRILIPSIEIAFFTFNMNGILLPFQPFFFSILAMLKWML